MSGASSRRLFSYLGLLSLHTSILVATVGGQVFPGGRRGPFRSNGFGQRPTGAACLSGKQKPINIMCASNVCIEGICAEGLAAAGETCDDDNDCENRACGRREVNGPYICCPSNATRRSKRQDWCDIQPIGADCLTSSVCASKLCVDRTCVAPPSAVPTVTRAPVPTTEPSPFSFIQCDGEEGDCCNGLDTICDLGVDDILYATAHDTMAVSENRFLVAQNNSFAPEHALEAGYRGIELKVCVCDGVYQFCNGICSVGTREIDKVFMHINSFLDEYPTEVVVIILQISDNRGHVIEPTELYSLAAAVPGFSEKLYQHPSVVDGWPTLREVIELNQRIIMFHYGGQTCDDEEEPPCPPGLHYYYDYAIDNFANSSSLNDLNDTSVSCQFSRVPNNIAGKTFFSMNHYVVPPNRSAAREANSFEFVRNRLEMCSQLNDNLDVNFVNADFWFEGELPQFTQEYNTALAQQYTDGDAPPSQAPTGLQPTVMPIQQPSDTPVPETTSPSSSPAQTAALIGDFCSKDGECLNGACGRKNVLQESPLICCPSNSTVMSNGEPWCNGQLEGAPCHILGAESLDAICASNLLCIAGVCRSELAGLGQPCDPNDHADCANEACGREKFVFESQFVCCSSNGTIASEGDFWCTGQLDGAACLTASTGQPINAVCASNLCLDGSCEGDVVRDHILRIARFGGQEFADPTSYQSRALDWVLSQNLQSIFNALALEEQAAQIYALACIYENTYGVRSDWTDFHFGVDVAVPGWFTSQGWMVEASQVCSWFGITCDDHGLVSQIELDTNGLTGYFPPETALLGGSLRKLDLFNNILHNKGNLGNSWLGEMTNMEFLFYGSTPFEYDGVPTEIGLLTNLIEYDFSYTLYFGELEGSTWSKLTNLIYLVMDGNAYASPLPQELVVLPNLQYVYAGFSFLEGDLEFVSQMPSVLEIWVDDNPGLSSSIPGSFANAATLLSFSASNCELTGTLPPELWNIRDIIQLWLWDNRLTGTIPSEFSNMVKLKILRLEANGLTGTVPSQLCNRLQPFGRLEEIGVDCDEVECPCCTCCGEACR